MHHPTDRYLYLIELSLIYSKCHPYFFSKFFAKLKFLLNFGADKNK